MLFERPQSDVYLDTAFVVNAVFRELKDSRACILATERLINSQRSAYVSEVVWIEYAQALRRLATRQRLPNELLERFELARWADDSVRHRWMNFGLHELNEYIRLLPEVVELPFNRTIFNESVSHMSDYSLGSLDAVHLATALHYEIPVFWTCDDHFARVDDLHVEIIRDGT